MELVIQIIAGLIGGNAAGTGLKNLSLGTAGNSVVGAVGGGLGGLLMGILGGDAAAVAEAAVGGGRRHRRGDPDRDCRDAEEGTRQVTTLARGPGVPALLARLPLRCIYP